MARKYRSKVKHPSPLSCAMPAKLYLKLHRNIQYMPEVYKVITDALLKLDEMWKERDLLKDYARGKLGALTDDDKSLVQLVNLSLDNLARAENQLWRAYENCYIQQEETLARVIEIHDDEKRKRTIDANLLAGNESPNAQ